MQIQEFNRQSIRNFEVELMAAMQEVAERYGVKVKNNGGKFTSMTLDAKFHFELPNAVKEDPHLLNKNRVGLQALGLPADSIGKTFVCNGKTYQIERIDLRKHKNPVIAKLVGTDRMFKFQESSVKFYFQLQNHG